MISCIGWGDYGVIGKNSLVAAFPARHEGDEKN